MLQVKSTIEKVKQRKNVNRNNYADFLRNVWRDAWCNVSDFSSEIKLQVTCGSKRKTILQLNSFNFHFLSLCCTDCFTVHFLRNQYIYCCVTLLLKIPFWNFRDMSVSQQLRDYSNLLTYLNQSILEAKNCFVQDLKFKSFSNYFSVHDEPREIQFWVANSNSSSFISLAVRGHSLYRLNYPLGLKKWHHVCTSWNGKTGEWQLWVKSERVGRGFYNRVRDFEQPRSKLIHGIHSSSPTKLKLAETRFREENQWMVQLQPDIISKPFYFNFIPSLWVLEKLTEITSIITFTSLITMARSKQQRL